MIDLHTHILPGMDDVAANIEETLEMLQIAANDGVEILAATPHVITGDYHPEKDDILQAVQILNQEITKAQTPVQVIPGAEIRLEPDLPQRNSQGELMTINDGGRHLLVELPTAYIPDYTERVLYDLQLQGIVPIIAHPERNIGFNNNPDLLQDLVSRGIIMQITTGSITGLFGRHTQKAALKLIQTGCVHIIATDMHSLRGHRTPQMSPAYTQVQKHFGTEMAEILICINPGHILKGENTEECTHKRRKWWERG